jgi:phosphoglycerate kinase
MGLETGNSLIERDRIELARRLLADSSGKLVVPSGAVVARELKAGADTRTVNRDRIPEGWSVYDIDPATEHDFAARIEHAGTVVWNGPMGVFETPPFDHGTLAIARAMAAATGNGAVTAERRWSSWRVRPCRGSRRWMKSDARLAGSLPFAALRSG